MEITKHQPLNELLNAQDVRKILRCSLPHVYTLAARQQIPCVRWQCPGEGTRKERTMVRFRLKDIHDFIEQNYQRGV